MHLLRLFLRCTMVCGCKSGAGQSSVARGLEELSSFVDRLSGRVLRTGVV